MARRVRWTEVAWRDLEAAADYIARDSKPYALALFDKARERARSLKTNPLRGRVVPEADDETIREVYVDRYRLMYKVTDDEVRIVAFIHGARDFERIWRAEKDERDE